ncbi:MAG: T9SS type A sorting domain-containing protein, partial [Candidatus Cloacimonetes bacterium]|nr:T9SS type A sorting domain-containing protein [Candidatus Cloacimonadota bacterium]
MKKTLVLVLLFTFVASLAFSSSSRIALDKAETKFEITENSYYNLDITFEFSEITTLDVLSENEVFTELRIPGGYSIGEIGSPKLPAIKKLIEIPFGAEVSINVLDYTISEYDLSDHQIYNKIMPVQPSLSKSTDPSTVPFEFNEDEYAVNAYNEEELASVEVLGTLRGLRLAQLVVAPVRYNPVKGKIKFYNSITVQVTFHNPDIAETEYIKASTYSPYYNVITERIFNGGSRDYPANPDLVTYPVKYLIVANRMFEATLEDFIEWKTQKGFEVIVGYTDIIGSTANQIKTWVHDQYNAGTPTDPAPSFVLFVGDTGQVVSETGSSTNKVTDLYYCSVDGDMFPEMYYGRFSATTTGQLQTQIDRTIYYEKYEFTDPSFLDNVTLIAGADASHNPSHGQPTVLYGTDNYFNTAHGFVDVHLYLTSPYDGCYDTINDGVSMINYTAHGSQTSWSNPSMTQTMVNNLTNVGKYTLAIGNCCLSGDFGYGECFGETWARATDNTTGEPTGAIGYIASAPSSYWHEDVYWSVGAFPFVGNGVTPTYDETSWGAYDAPFVSDYVCQDAMAFVGNLAVTEAANLGYPQHTTPLYYWQAYNLLGDPSVVVYMTQGLTNPVTFPGLILIGTTSFTVQAEEGSYVAISMNGVLHGTALADAFGNAVVTLDPPFTTAGTADIVVTKPQYQPVLTTVLVATPAVVNITPSSIPINTLTDVTIDVFEDDGTTPIPNVNILITGPGVYGTTSGITNASGSCTLNFGGEYGGAEILNVIGWRTGDSYNLVEEPFAITGGMDLTNPAIWLTTNFGLEDTFGLNLPGTVLFSQDEPGCTYCLHIVAKDSTIYSSEDQITYTPTVITDVLAGIMKSGYNMYQETFTTIEVFGTVSGIVTDSDNGVAIANAEVRFYEQGGDPNEPPLFSDETDATGFYEITTEYPVDYYDIYIDKWGCDPYQELGFFLNYGANTHNIVIDPGETSMVSGQLIDDFLVLGSGTLSYYRSDNGEEYATVGVTGGTYEVILPNFTYDIYVASPGHVPYSGTLIVEGDMIINYHLGNAAIFADFELDDGDFVSNDTNGWQWGVPSGGEIFAHSGTHCWATVIDGYYGTDNADWTLDSPEFSISGSGMLTFWHYYDFEGSYTYWDGGNVSISTNGGTTFEVITPLGGYTGTISALGEPGFGGSIDEWEQVEFDINGYTGDNAILRWHFGSDTSLHDFWGWYIDDVLYGDPTTSYPIPIYDNDPEHQIVTTKLQQNFPNPVLNSTTISFMLPVNASKAELKIYNIKGQLVQSFMPDVSNGPLHEVLWDGKDMTEKPVANGIYFYRLTTDNKEIIRKM